MGSDDKPRMNADLPRGPEAQLLLSILNQAMIDAEMDLGARKWIRDHWACAAYCALLNINRSDLVAAVDARYPE